MLNAWDDVIVAIVRERARQNELVKEGKFLFTCASDALSESEKLCILAEEFGEVAKEVTEFFIKYSKMQLSYISGAMLESSYLRFNEAEKADYLARVRKELVQVAAVCVAWCEAIDRVEGSD